MPEPKPAHNEAQDIALDDRLRGRASAGRRQAGRPGRPSGRRQSRRHLGQRLAPPLRRAPVAASAAWRGRASSTASTRTRPGCWSSPRPTSPMRASPRSSRSTASTGAIWRSSTAFRSRPQGTIDAPLARSSREPQEDRDRRGRPRQARGHPLSNRRAAAGTRRWSNAGSKPAAPTRSASTWPRSAIPCSATRFMAARGKAHRELLKRLDFHRQALHAAELGFIHPVTKDKLVVRKRHALGYAGTVQGASCIGICAEQGRVKPDSMAPRE